MEFYYNKFLNIYNKFYFYDLKYSLLLGREYELIYNFLVVYNSSILGDRAKKETLEDLTILEELVDGYITKLKTVFEDEEEIQDVVRIDVSDIYSILIESDCVWDNMAKSYSLLTKSTDCMLHKVLLIEINNFFSHILAASHDKKDTRANIKRGTAHLYRAALDGCKEIIKTNSNIICANSSLKKDFLKLRIEEGSYLGEKNASSKCAISKKYDDIANVVLTLLK